MSVADRLNWALKEGGHLPAHLAAASGVSRATVFSWLNGTTQDIRATHMLAAARFLRVSLAWLISGLGSPKPLADDWALSEDEKHLLTLVDRLQPAQRAALAAFIEAMTKGE